MRFATSWDATVSHHFEVDTVYRFAAGRLGVDPAAGLSLIDWLSLPSQGVLEVTAGPVFADRTGALARLHALLSWYPPQVELYVLAAAWDRIGQGLPMAGRTAACARASPPTLMRLAFLLHRRWAPYG